MLCIGNLRGIQCHCATKDNCLAGSNSNRALEVGNEFTVLLNKHGEVLDQFVINALLNSNLGTNLVLEGSDGEGKRREALASLSEESSGLLQFEVVNVLELALEHSSTLVAQLCLAFTGGYVDIEVDNLALLELPLLDVLQRLLLGDDRLVAINHVLLSLVGQNTLNHVATVLGSDLVHVLSNFSVGASTLDQTLSSTEDVVGSPDSVGSTRSSLVSNNDGVGGVDSKAVDVCTTHNLCDLTSLEDSRLILQGAVVTHNVVDRDATGESDTAIDLLGFLTVVDLLQFSLDVSIDLLAHLVDVSLGLAQGNGMLHSSYKHIKLDIPKSQRAN